MYFCTFHSFIKSEVGDQVSRKFIQLGDEVTDKMDQVTNKINNLFDHISLVMANRQQSEVSSEDMVTEINDACEQSNLDVGTSDGGSSMVCNNHHN